MTEQWRPVSGFESTYEISDQGNVRNIRRGSTLSKRYDRYGYVQYALWAYGKPYYFTAHRLVMQNFVGPRPADKEVCHNNGQHDDNRLENLRYDTHQSNILDSVKHGTHWSRKETRS